MAADPTYPLYPIACFVSAVMVALVLLTSYIRQSWSLGVSFLCFWLLFSNITSGINAIAWSDNASIKFYVYCDIVTHLQIVSSVAGQMATLIISRRLYSITSPRPANLSSKAAKYRNIAIEWTLGLVIPLIVAGPLYYIVQGLRFQVEEGFGCSDIPDGSILAILLIYSWSVVLPLLSVAIYYPRVARFLYRQNRDTNRFLQSNHSVTRINYIRMLALASVDVALRLPIGILNIVLIVQDQLSNDALPFYFGWTYDHMEWEPQGFTLADIESDGTSEIAQLYVAQWTPPVISLAVFCLFGITVEARTSYWGIICVMGGWLGWRPNPSTRQTSSTLGTIEFDEQPQDISYDVGMESRTQRSTNPNAGGPEQDAEEKIGRIASDLESTPSPDMMISEVSRVPSVPISLYTAHGKPKRSEVVNIN